MTIATKAKIILTIGFIVSLMILIILIGVSLVFIVSSLLYFKYAGLVLIGSFILSAVILGTVSNKVINAIQAVW